MKNIIPTTERLSKRFPIIDERCVLCINAVKTVLHVFKDCPTIVCFWLHNPLGLRTRAFPAISLSSWIIIY